HLRSFPTRRSSDLGAGPPSHTAPGKETVYDVDVPVTAMHQVDRLLELVRWTGADAPPRMTLAATKGPRGNGKRIGFHPTAANALKCWPLDSFVELARRLSGDATLVVFDTPKEPGPAR